MPIKNAHGCYPCKKCGSTDIHVKTCERVIDHRWWENPTKIFYLVSCHSAKCDHSTRTPEFNTPEEAREAWNNMMMPEPEHKPNPDKSRQAQVTPLEIFLKGRR